VALPFWHIGLPAAILVYSYLKDQKLTEPVTHTSPHWRSVGAWQFQLVWFGGSRGLPPRESNFCRTKMERARSAAERVIAAGHRINQTLDSVRNLFGAVEREQGPINMNEIEGTQCCYPC
jgi:hypothetical protein